MKKYYNNTTQEWYMEGMSITRNIENGMFSGIPTEEQLTEWGFEEYIEPEPTAEELLNRTKTAKISQLEEYDQSNAVNSFSINGSDLWLDAATRQQLKISLDAYAAINAETVAKWFNGAKYEYPLNTWYQMLNALEVYASEALNTTEEHKSNILKLDTIEAVQNYDFTQGYPEKLAF